MNLPLLCAQQRAAPEMPVKVDLLFFLTTVTSPVPVLSPADWNKEVSTILTFTADVLWAGVHLPVSRHSRLQVAGTAQTFRDNIFQAPASPRPIGFFAGAVKVSETGLVTKTIPPLQLCFFFSLNIYQKP